MNEQTYLTDSEIKNKILVIVDQLISTQPELRNSETMLVDDKLNVLISESSQALVFITTIEDEFDVELDDDDIDLDFFTDVDVMIARIKKNLQD
jgi:acyl carrier protein